MLLRMGCRIEGAVRERMLIAYYRHKGASSIDSSEDDFLLVRATGFSANTLDRNSLSRQPQGYPEEFFERIPRQLGISGSLVHMMVARLRSHLSTAALRRRFNLPIYFQLRLQETTKPLEAAQRRSDLWPRARAALLRVSQMATSSRRG